MLKEIFEQPKAVAETLVGRLGEDGKLILEEMKVFSAVTTLK